MGITKEIEIVYMSDMLPAHEGSGLGASSGEKLNFVYNKAQYPKCKKLYKKAGNTVQIFKSPKY